jgi:hypothetical protein
MCRNVRSIEWHQKTYHEISWDYPFKWYNLMQIIVQLVDEIESICETDLTC